MTGASAPFPRDSSQPHGQGFSGEIREHVSESLPAWPREVRPAESSPNVILIVVDDLGYSDIEPFGGEIDTPNLSQLARGGIVLTNYHTNPVCSPARASLMTGLNPHRAGFATVAHADPGFPNHTLELPESSPTIAESFRAAGYATFAIGKWHLTRESALHDGSDQSSWPVQRGFDRYFGSLDGFTQMFHPHRLTRDNSFVDREFADDEYLTDVLTDELIANIRTLKANERDKPFFAYFAHTAVHAPLQAKREDIEKYKDVYNAGWDEIREQRFARQKERGIIAETAVLPPPMDGGEPLIAWDNLSTQQKELYVRYMQVYAGAVDNIDSNLGRLLDALTELGQRDNTIIAFTSDNGASGEGGSHGTRSYFSQFLDLAEFPLNWETDIPRDVETLGGPQSSVLYPRGWASVSTTPFRYYKGHTFNGGIRAPLVLNWPAGLGDDRQRINPGYRYVTDLGLTLLDLAGVPHLTQRHGLDAPDVDGKSFASSLRSDDGTIAELVEQYWEYQGRRALISGSMKIVTEHDGGPIDDSEWQLYDLETDPTETVNRASQYPEVVKAMSARWRELAIRNDVFPINDDGSMWTTKPSSELRLETSVTLYHRSTPLERYRSARLTNLRSFAVEATLEIGDETGVILAHGDQGGGYVLFIDDDNVCVSYNEYGRMHRLRVPLDRTVPHSIEVRCVTRANFRCSVELVVDGETVGVLNDLMLLMGMAPFTGISVGYDAGSPVDWQIHERHGQFAFTGSLNPVTVVPGPRADYNPETIVEIYAEQARIYD